jgi:hypothetical protein
MRQKNKDFDCVEYQRAIRLKNYEEAGGDFNKMLTLRKERLDKNELLKQLQDKLKKSVYSNKIEYSKVNENEINYNIKQ